MRRRIQNEVVPQRIAGCHLDFRTGFLAKISLAY
jgi:hypothetical protein